jgi:hypothetical protein
MASARSAQIDRATRVVVGAYLALAVAPLVVAATQHWFWERTHSIAPVAVSLMLIVLVALIYRRRWAWMVLVIFEVGVLVSFAFHFTDGLALVATLASVALLLSSPMRRYVHQRDC